MLSSANFSEVEGIAQKKRILSRILHFYFGIWVFNALLRDRAFRVSGFVMGFPWSHECFYWASFKDLSTPGSISPVTGNPRAF